MDNKRQAGAIITEYLVVLVFMVAIVAYAMMGSPGDIGSVDGGMDGQADTDDPTVVSVLNDRQHEFARKIYQP